MILEFLRRRSVKIFLLAVGASLIIGFLSFSGMYVLLPLLPVAIAAFVLSIAYEGEIYYQNIKGAFDKLFNPDYLKQQLAKECLHELLPEIEKIAQLQFEKDALKLKTLETLDNLIQRIKAGAPREKLIQHYSDFLITYKKYTDIEEDKPFVASLGISIPSHAEFIEFSEQEVTACLQDVSSKIKAHQSQSSPAFFDDFLRFLSIHHQYDAPNLSGYDLQRIGPLGMSLLGGAKLSKRTIHLSRKKGEIHYSLITPDGREIHHHPTGIKAPKPFTLKTLNPLKEQILLIAKQNGHAHADHRDDKQKLKKSLETLEQVFADHLFETPNTPEKKLNQKTKRYLKSLQNFLHQSLALSALTQDEFATLQTVITNKKQLKYATPENYKTIRFTKIALQDLKKALQQLNTKEAQQISAKLVNNHGDVWQEKLQKRRWAFRAAKILSSVAALFMMLGTSYLLIEAFLIFPFMAAVPFGAWPAFVIPMAVIAGLAFGLLTFNAITDMINDDIILKRYRKMKEDWNKGLTFKSGLMLVTTVSLMVLTVALTICTAGTWWTVIKHTRPIFAFMRHIPAAVVGIAAGVLGLATFAFNVGNTLETLDEFDEEAGQSPYDIGLVHLDDPDDHSELKALFAHLPDANSLRKPTLIKRGHQYWMIGSSDGKTWKRTQLPDHCLDHINFDKPYLSFKWSHARIYAIIKRHQAHTFNPSPRKENWGQRLNPFRLILKLTYTPLRIGLFFGHLISIGVMGDRLPGIPQVLSALFGIVSEFFEDWHYFFSFKHAHRDDVQSLYDEYKGKAGGHDHTDDFPTRVLRQLFYPLIYLAAWWDSEFSDRKTDLPPLRKYASYWTNSEYDKELSFDEAMDKHLGMEAQTEVFLEKEDSTYVQIAHALPENQTVPAENPSQEPIALETEKEQPFLVDNLAAMTRLSLFKKERACPCPQHSLRGVLSQSPR